MCRITIELPAPLSVERMSCEVRADARCEGFSRPAFVNFGWRRKVACRTCAAYLVTNGVQTASGEAVA